MASAQKARTAYFLQKKKKRDEQKKRRQERRMSGAPRQEPRTLENTRERDATMLGSLNQDEEEELQHIFSMDEFSDYFNKTYEPKVLVTFTDNPHRKTRIFGKELRRIIPNSITLLRNRSGIKKMVNSCIERNFSDIVIINEDRCKPNGLLVIHLPNGPTANFKLSNVKVTTDIKRSHKEITVHRPEVILNNFQTHLGVTVSRMLASLFHYDPEFKGRRVVTFHNQRDYIFFRHHRYEFTPKGKVNLREMGPRFTLKLRSLQRGTFDSKSGEYVWMIAGRRHEMETSRRRFFL